MRNMVALFLISVFLVPFSAGALEMGPAVAVLDGQQLKWTDGPYGYHVMFKSQLLNLNTANDTAGDMYNPQADACSEQSVYQLGDTHLPYDAVIERAFLVWTAAQPTAKINDLTDNTVRLDFMHENDEALNDGVDVVGREAGLSDEQDFEFESFQQSDANGSRGFFTHRVDVTDFFKQLQVAAREEGKPAGSSLYGLYIVSGLECTNDPAYLNVSMMVANWSIILIYTSTQVPSRDIYLYNGVAVYQHVSVPWQLTGFTLPADPKILLTLNTHEGDGGLINPSNSTIPESLQLNGPEGEPVDLQNTCNYLTQGNNAGQPFYYTEVFNSISSVYGLDPTEGETCVGPGPGPNASDGEMIEYAIDMDTFYIDGATEPWAGQFPAGTDTLTVTLNANQDSFFTNFLLLAVEGEANFDIPEEATTWPDGREKHFCSCQDTDSYDWTVCQDRPYYYLIKVQNWGPRVVHNVVVVDDLSDYMNYIPGTTEMATQFDENGNGLDWMTIPDGPEDTIPLSGEGYQVADSMAPCDQNTKVCVDTRLVRFKVLLKAGLPKPGGAFIPNLALIKSSENPEGYKTNGGIPLKVGLSISCPSFEECPEPPKSECGGGDTPDDDALSDDDIITTDHSVTDTATNDADTTPPKKPADNGCGCSLVF